MRVPLRDSRSANVTAELRPGDVSLRILSSSGPPGRLLQWLVRLPRPASRAKPRVAVPPCDDHLPIHKSAADETVGS